MSVEPAESIREKFERLRQETKAVPPSRHAKPAKVGSGLLVAQATPWSINDERTAAWSERYRGRLIDVEAGSDRLYDVECLFPDRKIPIPLGDLESAMPICNTCTAPHIFRPDED